MDSLFNNSNNEADTVSNTDLESSLKEVDSNTNNDDDDDLFNNKV
jgi:hypothetical protein